MAPNSSFREREDAGHNCDPRDHAGAQVIDLATRNVLPTVTQRKKGDGLSLLAGIAFVALLGGVTMWSMDSGRRVDPGNRTTGTRSSSPPQNSTAQSLGSGPVVAPQPTIIGANNTAGPIPLDAPAPQPVLAAAPSVILEPQVNRYASPTVVFDAASSPATHAEVGGKTDLPNTNSDENFAARLGGLGGGSTSAGRSFDPATTVTEGTLIPAVLETAIDTDVPGFVRAIVSTDVRSFDGRTVLVPRSSRLIGQYKSGLSAGQRRAYVIWTRVIRPDGVSVDLGSPAIAFGGETGIAGKVNSHFFERFGSAMLLSVLGGLPNLIGTNSAVIVGGGNSAASAAVQQNGQVSPTIRVRQGEPIRVFTAKDLDFSKVK